VFDLYTYHIPELVIIKHNGDEPHKKRPERCFIYNESGDINPSEFSRITSLLLSKSDKWGLRHKTVLSLYKFQSIPSLYNVANYSLHRL